MNVYLIPHTKLTEDRLKFQMEDWNNRTTRQNMKKRVYWHQSLQSLCLFCFIITPKAKVKSTKK